MTGETLAAEEAGVEQRGDGLLLKGTDATDVYYRAAGATEEIKHPEQNRTRGHYGRC